MKLYKPPKRFNDLTVVLQYDSQQKHTFSITERCSINQERAKVLRDEAYEQSNLLNEKIDNVLFKIKITEWQPKDLTK